MVGKPNVLISMSGLSGTSYKMNQISNFSPKQLIQATENLQDDPKSGNAYKKIFEQIMKDKKENEYNRTKVQDRRNVLENTLVKERFDLNQRRAPRIIDNMSNASVLSRDSYLNKKIRANISRARALNPVLSQLGCSGVVSL